MRNKLFFLFLLAILTVIPTTLSAQRYFNSPLSRFNIGTLEKTGSFRSLAMGGTGTAVRTHDNIYFSNPASYSALDTNSFVFDFALDYNILSLSNGSDSYKSDDMGFHHIIMGFPISKKWGAALGIMPYSNSYYDLEGEDSMGSSVDHSGEGGITKLFVGTGIEVFKGLSLGSNMNILYGEITRSNYYLFDDDNVNNILSTEYLYLRGVTFDLGAQYSYDFGKNYFVNIGANTTFGNNLGSTYKLNTYTSNDYTSSIISTFEDDSTKAMMPTTLDAGISFGIKDKLVVAIDYATSEWSKATIYGSDGYLANSNSLRLGVEYIPEKQSYYNFLERMEYRLGGHIDNTYINLSYGQVKEYGFTFGLGIPMRRSYSKVNLYMDYSKKSLPSASTITHLEDCLSFGISLNLYELWFEQTLYK